MNKDNPGEVYDKMPKHIKILTVTLDTSTNQVNVAGAIGDKIMCYGMLTMAQEAVFLYHEQRAREERGAVLKQASDIILEK